MKFDCSVEINEKLEKVIHLFDNVDHLEYWQEGFISHTPLANKTAAYHSRAKLVYKMAGKSMNLLETIYIKNLPEELYALYEHVHMDNTMRTSFTASSTTTTVYRVEIEYLKFYSLIPKLMAKFFPSMFQKQTQKWLDNFKQFVEEHR